MRHIEFQEKLRDQMDRSENETSFVRLGVGLFALTLAYFGALAATCAVKAIKQTFKLAKTLTVLVCVYLVYHGMTQIFSAAISHAIFGGIKRITERGSISERVGNVIGAVILVAAIFAVYRILAWGLEPITRALPKPGQTTMTDYLTEQYGDTDDTDGSPFDVDPEEGTLQHKIVHGPNNGADEI